MNTRIVVIEEGIHFMSGVVADIRESVKEREIVKEDKTKAISKRNGEICMNVLFCTQ